jgi:hypothetical protein
VFYHALMPDESPPTPLLRRCSMCLNEKLLTEFHRRGDRHQWWCKACRRPYDAAYHAGRRSLRIGQKRERRRRLSAWLDDLKSRPCVDCGGRFHPAAMQFDHLPGTSKRDDVSDLVKHGCVGLARAEILKCELVCANCHAVRTYSRREDERSRRAAGGTPSISESAAVYLTAA